MNNILKTLIFLLLVNTSFAQGSFINDSLDSYIKREMIRWNLPGLAIAIVKDGNVIVKKGYGYADVAKKIPVTEKTEFQIASCSKAFTGTSVAMLEHYGKLKLDDKVKTYLPYFKMHNEYLTNHVTIRDVLSHRIGYGTFQTDLLNWGSTKTRKELVENMANVIPENGFREKYGYCNMGFVIASEVILAASDTTWDDYLKYHYFLPLGMTRTGTTYQNFISSPNASKAYSMVKGKLFEIPAAKIDNMSGAASITSNVDDLSKWVMMQLANGMYNGKQVVPVKVIEETRLSNTVVSRKSKPGRNFMNYGLGWFLVDSYGKKIVQHDGGANGFLSKTLLLPEDNFGLVILSNSDAQSLFDALSEQILKDINKQPYTNVSATYYEHFKESYKEEQADIKKLKTEVASYRAPADAYKKLAGIYNNNIYGKITIEPKAGYAEVSFEFHPHYKGKIQFKNATTMMIEYNDESTLGVKEIHVTDKDIEIKVVDFLDRDTYLFTKVSDTFKAFDK